jgi:pyrimidine-nucleoside phosphorylase/thymidine phosphorylase
MRVADLIRQKREGAEITPEQINFLIGGYTRGEIPDYQISALLMAIVWRGMTHLETAAFTDAMLRSGHTLDLSDLSAKKVDKHSTGGVGDKTSLIIAPIVAAGGLVVPMISGRGLGHTGGTLDKLESIPGFNVNLSLADFRCVLGKCGCALIGATAEIAPADKKIYALRDVTATVESPALICASIMSKKLAEGVDALVLDVKTGSGAFLKSEKEAVGLAELMVETGRRMGKRVVALITEMDQPLGRAAGNAMEVVESIEILNGKGPADLRELCLELSAWMFYLGERVASVDEGKRLAADQIDSGRAKEKFREIIRLQGGDEGVVDHPERLAKAQYTAVVTSPANGYAQITDCEKLGRACIALGAGRNTKEDAIDPAVGLFFHRKRGDAVRQGEVLCTIHYNSPARLDDARRLIAASFQITREAPKPQPLVRRVIGAPGANA